MDKVTLGVKAQRARASLDLNDLEDFLRLWYFDSHMLKKGFWKKKLRNLGFLKLTSTFLLHHRTQS